MTESMLRFLIIAGLGLFVLTWLSSARMKGVMSEWLFARLLRMRLPRDTYHLLHNIALRLPDGSTTQIDHIVVSCYGIFVIELKNYQGWIYGDPYAPTWTQTFGKNRKYAFQNPIRQNYRHIKALAELTGIPENLFQSLIVFVGGCTLKTRDKLPPHVLTTGETPAYLLAFRNLLIPDHQVAEIVETIRTWQQHSNVSHREHVENLRRRKQGEGSKKDNKMKPIHTIILAVGAIVALSLFLPQSDNPYRMEMDGLMHENVTLNRAMREAILELEQAKAQASRLKSDNQRLEMEAAFLRTRIEEVSAQHDALKLQYGLMTEREREASEQARRAEAQRAEARRQEELRRQQQIDAIAAANRTTTAQPPFRVFDVIHAGKKTIDGKTGNFGRFSVRNYTDRPIEVIASSGIAFKSVTLAPNSASNSIWIRAEKGAALQVKTGSHAEQHTW
ncbi:MAG TPA: NERD domain-containing protein [Kiritimatiellia bacterium]|nr:NERD domain-containing protein [Kiritimatiellia bacterium]HMO99751.1 NERD domain-containing protein [Kiritimatiellia bacterium]HMP00022.1 NERD domain-containing protein [Kiritimatiellia bacterium]